MRSLPSADLYFNESTTKRMKAEVLPKDKYAMRREFNTVTEGENQTFEGQIPRKHISNVELFRQIINEKHTITKLNQSPNYNRFSKKLVTPALRNGIFTRAFNRNKLELFTRPDPIQLTLNLKTRVNNIVHNSNISQLSGKNKSLSRCLPIKRNSTEGNPFNRDQDTQRTRLKNLIDQSVATISQSKKDLSLKDFPAERASISQHNTNRKSKKEPKTPSQNRNTSINLCIADQFGKGFGDFFPYRYKLEARKDQAIINAFNQSYTASGRNSIAYNRPSGLPISDS